MVKVLVDVATNIASTRTGDLQREDRHDRQGRRPDHHAEVKFDGTADVELLNPDDASTLLRTHGNAAGTDGNIMIKMAFGGEDGGAAGWPVEHGTYCKS